MSVLVVAEHVRGALRPVTLELVSAARELGGPVAVAVIAADPSALTDAVNVEGVDEILAVRVEQEAFENDVYQQAVEALIEERSPRAVLAERSYYGAKVNAEVEFPGHDCVLLLIRPTSWQPAGGSGSATVTEVGVPAAASRARHRDWVEVQAGG